MADHLTRTLPVRLESSLFLSFEGESNASEASRNLSASKRHPSVRDHLQPRSCAHGCRETRRQDKTCCDQGARFSKRETTLAPHRRDSFSFHAGTGSMRRFSRRKEV